MKNLLLALSLLVAVNAAATNKFEVTGAIDNYNGRVFLVSLNYDKGVDTLSTAFAIDGKFVLEGELPAPRVAELHADNTDLMVPIFLEEASFQVQASLQDPNDYEVAGGAELQKTADKYAALKKKSAARRDSIRRDFHANHDMTERFWKMQMQSAFQNEAKIFDKEEDEFLAAHDNLVSAFVLCRSLPRITQDKSVARKYELLGECARNSVPGHLLKPIAEKFAQITVGGILPDISLCTPDGAKKSLHSIAGKLKIIDFWASWCGPCRAEIPNMKGIYQDYKDKGLEIVGLSMDADRESWMKALEIEQMAWPQLCGFEDLDLIRSTYNVYAIPYIFVLDEDNRIIGEGLRGEKLREFVSQHLD